MPKHRGLAKRRLVAGLTVCAVLAVLVSVAGYLYFSSRPASRARGEKRPRPNIVLITIDALRPDRLGCYGHDKNVSPTIDRLARQGALFAEAISQGSITFTSFPSLLTSTYPSTAGIYSTLRNKESLRLQRQATFSRRLRKFGYRTGFFSAHPLGLVHNREQFDTVYIYAKKGSPGATASADQIVGKVKDWLERIGDGPFFVWVHFMEVHDVPAPGGLDQKQKAALLPRFLGLYDRAIRVVDAQIDLLMGHIRKRSTRGEPVVVITADHGEVFNDHGLYFDHGIGLWDQLIHVPLVLYGPGFVPKGRRVDGQVQLIDVGPTLCRIAGVPTPRSFEGKSLYPLTDRAATTRFAFSENVETKSLPNGEQSYLVSLSVRDHPWHLIYSSEGEKERYSVYNLEQDPLEKVDLIQSEAEVAENLRRVLKTWKTRSTRTWTSDRAGVKPIYPANVRRALESLGYVQ